MKPLHSNKGGKDESFSVMGSEIPAHAPGKFNFTGLLLLGLMLAGCATRRPEAVVEAGAPVGVAPIRLEPGPIGVRAPAAPAQFSFDKARGQIRSPGQAAGRAAGRTLETSTFADPALEMGAGAVRFVLAPVTTIGGALGPGREKLPAVKLAESEADLSQAMSSAAGQEQFREYLLKTAEEKAPRRLVPLGPLGEEPGNLTVSAVLEAKTEELQLQRISSSDDTFALRIKTRVRLMRPDDGAVLFEQPFEFRSGRALFVAWTRQNGLQSVVDTGYRVLAERVLKQLFSSPSDAPVLLGAGYKQNRRPAVEPPFFATVHQAGPKPTPVVEFASQPALGSTLAAGNRVRSSGGLQFINDWPASPGGLGIYSTTAVTHVTIQRPLTREEAGYEALDDVEWTLDGLDNSHNSVVMLTACAAAVPISLWKQTVAAVQGLGSKRYREADERLTAAAREFRPQEQLAYEVAQQLSPKTAQPVMLVKAPLRQGSEGDFELMQCAARGTLASLPKGQSAENYLISQGADTALEIHVKSAALIGEGGGPNPLLALSVTAEAKLFRVRDGQPIYSYPVSYRSRSRKFTEWASENARPFRQELEDCYRKMGGAIVGELVSRRLVAPDRLPSPTLATNGRP